MIFVIGLFCGYDPSAKKHSSVFHFFLVLGKTATLVHQSKNGRSFSHFVQFGRVSGGNLQNKPMVFVNFNHDKVEWSSVSFHQPD